MHAEMTLDGQLIMMGQGSTDWRMQSPSETKVATMGIFIYLNEVDAHYERARDAGAEIVEAPYDEPYGRTYTARSRWTSLVLHHATRLNAHCRSSPCGILPAKVGESWILPEGLP
jgi:hypothetical protein